MNKNIHARDKRLWFQIYCCNRVVKPMDNRVDMTSGVGFALAGIMAVVLIGLMIHYIGATASAGVLAANAGLVSTEQLTEKLQAVLTDLKESKSKHDDIEKK